MPFTPEQLAAVRTIICYADCPDGLASAMILADALPRASVRFVQYGAELDALEPELGMLFCDIAPTTSIPSHLDGTLVLDHHKTAKSVVGLFAELDLGHFADEREEPGVSGALLAYRHVWRPLRGNDLPALDRAHRVQVFAELAGVRDTWQTKDPRWDEACAQSDALMFYGSKYLLDRSDPFLREEEMRVGCIVRDRRREKARKTAREGLVRLGRVGIFNDGRRIVSDVAEAVRESVLPVVDGVTPWYPSVVAGFFYVREMGLHGEILRLVFSLRAVDDSVDVSKIAKASGGGGHRGAAGFPCSVSAMVACGSPVEALEHAFAIAGRRDLVDDPAGD